MRRTLSKVETIKQYAIKILIVSLIAAATLAVIAVVVGQLTDILSKSLWTLVLVAGHALASLAYLRLDRKPKDADELGFFTNVVFFIILLSFIASIFWVWGIISSDLGGKLYLTYFVFLFAALHGDMLSKTLHHEPYIDKIVYANYVFMAIVILMLLPVIYVDPTLFGGAYFRLLAAAGIIDATLSILAVIFDKLYLMKHPQTPSQLFVGTVQFDANGQPISALMAPPKRHTNPLLILLGVYIFGQIFISLLFAVTGGRLLH
jgi:hypothetical protein